MSGSVTFNIAWFSVCIMFGSVILVCAKILPHIRPFHSREHRGASLALVLMAAIAVITLVESILVQARFSDLPEMGYFIFSSSDFLAFAFAFYVVVPDLYPQRKMRENQVISHMGFRTFFFCLAMIVELFAFIAFCWIYTIK